MEIAFPVKGEANIYNNNKTYNYMLHIYNQAFGALFKKTSFPKRIFQHSTQRDGSLRPRQLFFFEYALKILSIILFFKKENSFLLHMGCGLDDGNLSNFLSHRDRIFFSTLCFKNSFLLMVWKSHSSS